MCVPHLPGLSEGTVWGGSYKSQMMSRRTSVSSPKMSDGQFLPVTSVFPLSALLDIDDAGK